MSFRNQVISFIKNKILPVEQVSLTAYLLKWLFMSLIIGSIAGSASAAFLVSLDRVTDYREANMYIIWLLPIAGLIIGLTYHYLGKEVEKGNNQILDEFHSPKQIIPLKMAPLVLISTLITHLFGGSAGREGTAVQMGGAISDQFTRILKFKPRDRKILLIIGISAGFGSVFGTPLAGAVFALEVLLIGKMSYEALVPSVLTAYIADYTCRLWNVGHTSYSISNFPDITAINIIWAIIAGIIFGITALTFTKNTKFWTDFFKKTIKYPPFRPLVGGIILAITIFLIGTTKYIGLGIPTIADSFINKQNSYDFIIKIIFTSFTLGAGFKGGEVTPLFFIGAVLGNALSFFIPLPMALLAGMGFVAVFAGATNTPIACTIMGLELFGVQGAAFIAIACVVSYLFSGHSGIYHSQIIGSPKHKSLIKSIGKKLSEQKDKNSD